MLNKLKDMFNRIINFNKKNFYIFFIILFFCLPIITKPLALDNHSIFWLLGQKQEFNETKLSLSSFFNKDFQKNYEKKFGYSLTFNSLFVKSFNTIMFYVFNKSYSDGDSVVIGKDKCLFGTHYFATYMSDLRYDPIDIEKTNRTIRDIKEIQDYLKAKDKLLILLVAPNKATLYPQFLPYRYSNFNKHKRTDKDYYFFMNVLQQNGINYINTRDYLNLVQGKHEIFEKDDIVWSFYTVFVVAQKLIDKINTLQSDNIEPLKLDKTVMHNTSSPINKTQQVLNIFVNPENYSYEEVIPVKNKKVSNKKVAIVGGCFTEKLILLWNNANVFSDIEHYITYSINSGNEVIYQVFHVSNNPIYKVSEKETTVTKDKLIDYINKNDIIILDFNESFLLHAFLDEYIPLFKKYMKENPVK